MSSVRSLILATVALATFPSWACAADQAPTIRTNADGPVKAAFPQQRNIEGYTLTIYAPQVRTWPEFKQFTASIAFALTPVGGAAPQYGTATVAGNTAVDLDNRIVRIDSPKVTDVTFTNPVPADYSAAVVNATTRDSLDVRLDLFLSYLAEDALPTTAPAGFNMAPPPIVVRSTPTALLFVDGEPVTFALPNSNLDMVANANWPLLRQRVSGA